MRKFLILFMVMWSCVAFGTEAQKVLPINQGWQFRQAGKGEWLSAVVPGTVQQDLLRHKLLPDPFYGMNEEKVQWVEDRDWEYRTAFSLSKKDLQRDAAELVFEGLDTYAEVYVNDALVLEAENMFVGYRVDVKNHLCAGENALRIVFRSPINAMMPKRNAAGFDYPADNDHRAEKLSIYTRKAPYSYGWDWGIRMVTAGVWRPVSLRLGDVARIDDLHIRQESLTKQRAKLSCAVRVRNFSQEEQGVTIRLSCPLSSGGEIKMCFPEKLPAGESVVELPLAIANPQLWMPNGWGEPHLYNIKAELIAENDKVVDARQERIGLRTLRVVTEKDKQGESFYFEVNGIPMFAKGANYIPQDALLPAVDEARYRRLFADIKAANMNMIRVWGGGTYESDLFYDLADENGILVWQDFMFACTTYPHDAEFKEQVRAEAKYNIERLRNHPSLALWCGNNEIAEGLKYWGWNGKYSPEVFADMKQGYNEIFCQLLPEAVVQYDPERFYMHSSPMVANWGRPATWGTGDSHNWGVWYGQKPFECLDHDLPRFMSEFGFQAFPEMKTIAAFASEDQYALESEVMTAHQKSSIGNDLILRYMQRDYRVPESFEDFVYVGLVMQGEGMRRGFEAHRRNRPYCMGTLYWQLNDSWPVVSWSSIDYYGNWKALHYEAQRAFAPLAVSVFEEDNKLQFWLLSDLLEAQNDLQLEIRLMDFEGKVFRKQLVDCSAQANVSELLHTESLEQWAQDPAHTFLSVRLLHNAKPISEDTHFFAKTKDLDLPEAEIVAGQEVRDGECILTLRSPKLAKNLFVECSIQGARFSDNFFNLLPNEERTIRISSPEIRKGEELDLRFNHIRKTYK